MLHMGLTWTHTAFISQVATLGALLGVSYEDYKRFGEWIQRGAKIWARQQIEGVHDKVAVARALILRFWPRPTQVGNTMTGKKQFGQRSLPKYHWMQVGLVSVLEVSVSQGGAPTRMKTPSQQLGATSCFSGVPRSRSGEE